MLSARRYEKIEGALPQFFTLYGLESLDVLTSPAYRRLLDNPTEWSRRMRPAFRGFMRLCCHRAASAGGGLGGWLLATVVSETADFNSIAWRSWLMGLFDDPAVVAAHMLRTDPGIPEVPFNVGGDTLDFPRAGAILIESYSGMALAKSRQRTRPHSPSWARRCCAQYHALPSHLCARSEFGDKVPTPAPVVNAAARGSDMFARTGSKRFER